MTPNATLITSALQACGRPARPRRGVVLIIVLVVVVLLSLAAYTFTNLMVTHRQAVQLSGRQIQSRAMVDSGIEMVRMFLIQDEATQYQAGGIFDNPVVFQGALLVDDQDPQLRGRFSLICPATDDDGYTIGYRYGLEDESARINLNTLLAIEEQQPEGGRNLLMTLPGMTLEIADAILDWMDEDDERREYGAEVGDYYTTLDPPYAPKNGPLESVEELLLVRDVLPELLFGSDNNRNGVIEQRELNNGQMAVVVDDLAGSMDRGWAAYLTLYSREQQLNSLGQPLINLNSDDLEQLYADLVEVVDPLLATFIIGYRQNGPYDGDDPAVSEFDGELDLTQPTQARIDSILDLIGTKVQVTFAGQLTSSIIDSGLANDFVVLQDLPLLADTVTTIDEEVMAGRININFAPRSILAGLPGMTEDLLEEIVLRRSAFSFDPSDVAWQHETWLLSEGLLATDEGLPDLQRMRELMPYITAKGSVYRAQVVGFYEGGGASSRAEVVFDTTGAVPRVLFWRDISRLGRGYDLVTLGADVSANLQTR